MGQARQWVVLPKLRRRMFADAVWQLVAPAAVKKNQCQDNGICPSLRPLHRILETAAPSRELPKCLKAALGTETRFGCLLISRLAACFSHPRASAARLVSTGTSYLKATPITETSQVDKGRICKLNLARRAGCPSNVHPSPLPHKISNNNSGSLMFQCSCASKKGYFAPLRLPLKGVSLQQLFVGSSLSRHPLERGVTEMISTPLAPASYYLSGNRRPGKKENDQSL